MERRNDAAVTATLVPEEHRLKVLPRLFGRSMLKVETAVYAAMAGLCRQYSGGYWHFYTLSNGGFYMAPSMSERLRLQVDGNGYDGAMSADAAGIVAVLMVFSRMSFSDENFGELFHALRDFALDHAEQSAIFRAID